MFGVVGYCPANITPRFRSCQPHGQSRNRASLRLLISVTEISLSGPTSRRRALAHSLAAIRILSGARLGRNRATVENAGMPVEKDTNGADPAAQCVSLSVPNMRS